MSTRSKWVGPAVFALCGLVMAGAQVGGGHPASAIFDVALFGVIAAALAVGGRSDTVRGFRGDGTDERFRSIERRAAATSGGLVAAAIVVGLIVEIARGHSGAPFSWLAAIAGAGYLIAYMYGTRR